MQLVPAGRWPSGAPRVLNSTPDEAVVSFDAIVLLMMFTFSASSSEIPAPSQPATLLVMMLLVTETVFQCAGVRGERDHVRAVDALEAHTAAAAAFRRVAHDQVGVDDQARTGAVARPDRAGRVEHAILVIRSPQGGSASGAPMMTMPPPLVGMVGLVLWLNRIDVVLDVAVVAEAEVTEAAAVARAQVAAHPVVVELVVVGAGAEADAARSGRRGREQFVADGGVRMIALWCTFTWMS